MQQKNINLDKIVDDVLSEGIFSRLIGRSNAIAAADSAKDVTPIDKTIDDATYKSIKVKAMADSILARFKRKLLKSNEVYKRNIESSRSKYYRDVNGLVKDTTINLNKLLKEYKDVEVEPSVKAQDISGLFHRSLYNFYKEYTISFSKLLQGLFTNINNYKIGDEYEIPSDDDDEEDITAPDTVDDMGAHEAPPPVEPEETTIPSKKAKLAPAKMMKKEVTPTPPPEEKKEDRPPIYTGQPSYLKFDSEREAEIERLNNHREDLRDKKDQRSAGQDIAIRNQLDKLRGRRKSVLRDYKIDPINELKIKKVVKKILQNFKEAEPIWLADKAKYQVFTKWRPFIFKIGNTHYLVVTNHIFPNTKEKQGVLFGAKPIVPTLNPDRVLKYPNVTEEYPINIIDPRLLNYFSSIYKNVKSFEETSEFLTPLQFKVNDIPKDA